MFVRLWKQTSNVLDELYRSRGIEKCKTSDIKVLCESRLSLKIKCIFRTPGIYFVMDKAYWNFVVEIYRPQVSGKRSSVFTTLQLYYSLVPRAAGTSLSAVCLLDFGSFISIEVCRDCIPALASSCKKQLTGSFVCLLFFLKVKCIS